MEKIKNIKVPLEVILGTTEATIEDVSKISIGSILELTSYAGEPVTLRAAGEAIAKGEVVVIDENFGLRVTEVIDKENK